jgi:serralysin
LNGTGQQQEMVRRAATAWLAGELGSRLQFRFDVPQKDAQITINMASNRNNSIVGRNSIPFAPKQATMNLSDIVDSIIMHEFGHALGLQHEHQHPQAPINWNRSKVYADMAAIGWTPDMVDANIFARLGSNLRCIGSPGFDAQSIMLYPVPAGWATNFVSGLNMSISDADRKCLIGLYRA